MVGSAATGRRVWLRRRRHLRHARASAVRLAAVGEPRLLRQQPRLRRPDRCASGTSSTSRAPARATATIYVSRAFGPWIGTPAPVAELNTPYDERAAVRASGRQGD